jgi:Ulp1 family protease
LNTKSDHSSDSNVELVEQDTPKLSYFDSSDAHDKIVKGNHANLVFHLDTIVMKNANDINQLNKDSFTANLYMLKLTMKKYHPILYPAHMM